MKILHVVRRYGPVGGMERYVWELTRELRNLGHEVEVLCEVCLANKPKGIVVHELGTIALRPRWISLMRFSRRVTRWLDANPRPDSVIHSNERLRSHHITTFHGPPFATVFEKPWWRMISIRVVMQLYLERCELTTAKYIVPNSIFIRQQLSHYYPELAHKLTEPIVPGVLSCTSRVSRYVPENAGVVGFVGKEWKRKGLPFAVKIIKQLRRKRPFLKFCVIVPDVDEVQSLLNDAKNDQLLGWSNVSHYTEFDVLLHPARAEPYGMVISEAMAACVPVVISDVCGAAIHVTTAAGSVLSLSASVEIWADAVEKQLLRGDQIPKFERSWREVAGEYETLYCQLNCKEHR